MPTALHRIQVLLNPDESAKVKTLCKMERRSQSAMVAELVNAALKMPKFVAILQEAEESGATVPTKEEKRNRIPRVQFISRKEVSDEHEGKSFTRVQLDKIAEALIKGGIDINNLDGEDEEESKEKSVVTDKAVKSKA